MLLRRNWTDWRKITDSLASAEAVAKAMSSKHKIEKQAKKPHVIGIIKRIPESVSEEELPSLIPGCEKATRCGETRAHKLYFSSKTDLLHAIAQPIKFCQELFKIEEFGFLPRRCYRCH